MQTKEQREKNNEGKLAKPQRHVGHYYAHKPVHNVDTRGGRGGGERERSRKIVK